MQPSWFDDPFVLKWSLFKWLVNLRGDINISTCQPYIICITYIYSCIYPFYLVRFPLSSYFCIIATCLPYSPIHQLHSFTKVPTTKDQSWEHPNDVRNLPKICCWETFLFWDLLKWYCWWFRNPAKTVEGMVVYPVIYQVLYIPGGAEFLPSTVWWNPNQPTMSWLEVENIPKWKRNIILESRSMKVFCGRVCRVHPPKTNSANNQTNLPVIYAYPMNF